MNASHALPLAAVCLGLVLTPPGPPDEKETPLPRAFIDGTGPGWRALDEKDFVNVNCDPDTWTWKDGVAHATGKPTGVIRSKEPITNFELVAEWRHLKSGGNSGIFTIDLATNALVGGAVDTPFPTPHNIALTRDGAKMYVTHSGATADKVSVYAISPADGRPTFLSSITVGTNPFGIARLN